MGLLLLSCSQDQVQLNSWFKIQLSLAFCVENWHDIKSTANQHRLNYVYDEVI